MNTDPGVLCVRHCGANIFAFQLPDVCPLCQNSFGQHDFPFRIPCPFVRASQHACCVVLKPTRGDFLSSYSNTEDLHIGITDCQGKVHAYDERGVSCTDDWTQCLAIPALQDGLYQQQWEESLRQHMDSTKWNADRYDGERWNCYTFVLTFLSSLNFTGLQLHASDKHLFCQHQLLPVTSAAAKYISVYRRLRDQGLYVQV